MLNKEKFKCEVCGKYILDDEGVTTLTGLWVCNKSSCRNLDSENQAIEKIGDN